MNHRPLSTPMTKRELRKYWIMQRAALSEEKRSQMNAVLTQRLWDFLVSNPPTGFVHSFLPIVSNREVDTWQVIQKAWVAAPEIRWVAPKTVMKDKTLEHIPIHPDSSYSVSKWGITEPLGVPVDVAGISHAITPLLCFDKDGFRIGYGGGFYDRFFEKAPHVIRIGVSLFDPIESIAEKRAYDLPLHYCITPSAVRSWL